MSSRVRVTLKMGNHIFINNRAHRELLKMWQMYGPQTMPGTTVRTDLPKWQQSLQLFNTCRKAGILPGSGIGIWARRDNRKLSYKRSGANPHNLGYLPRTGQLRFSEAAYKAGAVKFTGKVKARQYKREIAEILEPESVAPNQASIPTAPATKKGAPKVGIWA